MADRSVVVIAAHPDDEILGCGGTVARHTADGDRVTFIIVCEGESLRYGPGAVGQHEHIACAAAKLGVTDVRQLGFPDQRLDTFTLTDIITPIERVLQDQRPSIVYTQFGGDVNRDHQILFQAVLVATRPTEEWIGAVYAYDTASSTEWAYPRSFVPDTWVDVTATLERKLDAMSCYESELRPYPHPRSLEALRHRARAWGNMCCLEAAEVFMTVRRIRRDGETLF
jgi:LmbE family N-acetylglucosaminyl deacetylase